MNAFRPTFLILTLGWTALCMLWKPHPPAGALLWFVAFWIVACTAAKCYDDRRANTRHASQSPPRE